MGDAKDDLQVLMSAALPLAKQMLAEHHEFYPYGSGMRADGTIVQIGARQPGTDRPKSSTLIEIRMNEFQNGAADGRYIATALVLDVKIRPPGGVEKIDAIQVNLDHVNHLSIEVLHPYKWNHRGVLEYEHSFAQRGGSIIFSSRAV